MHRRFAPQGFTVLEMLITVSVLSVLVAIAVPSFRTTILNNRRAAVLNEFVVSVNFARATALTRRVPITICRTSTPASDSATCADAGNGWETGWMVFVDTNNDGDRNAGETEILRRHEALPAGQTLRGNTNIVNRITFGASATTVNNGKLAFCDTRGWGTDSRVLTLSVGGRLQNLLPAQDTSNALTSCTPAT